MGVIIVTTTLLKIYLDTGTKVLSVRESNSIKFCIVGFRTINVGGKRNNSCKGLNAWLKIYTIGNNIKIDSRVRKNKIRYCERSIFMNSIINLVNFHLKFDTKLFIASTFISNHFNRRTKKKNYLARQLI